MNKYISIYDIRVPAYGLTVIIGILICNCFATVIAKKNAINFRKIFMLELIGGTGAILGAKLFSMLSYMVEDEINFFWSSFKDAGYSYYGGLAGFLIFIKLYCLIFEKNTNKYNSFVFLIPLLHMFWKFGCFWGGCCVGIPYDGPFSVVFPEKVNQLSGVNVFPVQLLEALVALIISIVIEIMYCKKMTKTPVGWLLIFYSVTRFGIEFLRFNPNTIVSIGHINSLLCFGIGVFLVNYIKIRRPDKNERARTKDI